MSPPHSDTITAADKSKSLKTKRATPIVNVEHGYSYDYDDSDAGIMQDAQMGDGGDGRGLDASSASLFPKAWSAWFRKECELKNERHMHESNSNFAEAKRVQREINKHIFLDLPSFELLRTPSQDAPPTSLNLHVTLPLGPFSDFVFIGTDAVGRWKLPPPNLDYHLLDFDLTILEMATYIPLAHAWQGFLARFRVCTTWIVFAKMMLWARSRDNGPNLEKKLLSLSSLMDAEPTDADPTDADPTSADKSASSWIHGDKFISEASPTLIADIALVRLGRGVTRHPQGQHRGRLTIAIQHAELHGHQDVMLSQVKEYIQYFKLSVPAPLAAGDDLAAVNDFENMYAAEPH